MAHSPMPSPPLSSVAIDASSCDGPLELWRHALSLGGISPEPLPAKVIAGVSRLKPRLIRIFIQEFFNVYPGHGRYDWSRLDAYMDSVQATGANIVAAITIKPRVLYPDIDEARWMPNDVEEWQQLIAALVHRYSNERGLVTWWEIGNETDIGEAGGAPYLIPDPVDYGEFYRITAEAVLGACPTANVGGPAACWVDNEPLPGFVDACRENGTQLDFISWHLYSNDPQQHAMGVSRARQLLSAFDDDGRPEMLVTEWAKGFEHVSTGNGTEAHPLSVAEMATDARVAAITAASAIAMTDAGVDWSFYYHLWDQACDPEEFRRFFSPAGAANMVQHWNEFPHRFGLFSVEGEMRPHYLVFAWFGQLGSVRLRASAGDANLYVIAGRDRTTVSSMIANVGTGAADDRIVEVNHATIGSGRRVLSVYSIDNQPRRPPETAALEPVERRTIFVDSNFRCQVLMPADSVTMIRIEGGS